MTEPPRGRTRLSAAEIRTHLQCFRAPNGSRSTHSVHQPDWGAAGARNDGGRVGIPARAGDDVAVFGLRFRGARFSAQEHCNHEHRLCCQNPHLTEVLAAKTTALGANGRNKDATEAATISGPLFLKAHTQAGFPSCLAEWKKQRVTLCLCLRPRRPQCRPPLPQTPQPQSLSPFPRLTPPPTAAAAVAAAAAAAASTSPLTAPSRRSGVWTTPPSRRR